MYFFTKNLSFLTFLCGKNVVKEKRKKKKARQISGFFAVLLLAII
jgi:hypothetical protein